MEITFDTGKLEKLCNSEKKLRSEYGPRQASLIMQRLSELDDSDTLEMMRHLPGARCHELTGNFKGHLAVDLVHPDRLVFRPDHSPIPVNSGGGLDWRQVTKITVIGIGDYH